MSELSVKVGTRCRRGAAAALAALLAGCGWGQQVKLPCPRVAVVADAAEIVVFRPGPGRDLTDIEYRAEFANVASACDYRERNSRVLISTALQILVERGPAARGDTVDIPYFIAVADGELNILAKSKFDSRIDFRAGARRAGASEETEQEIPLAAGRDGTDYEVLIGFQLTSAQLDYLRTTRRQR